MSRLRSRVTFVVHVATRGTGTGSFPNGEPPDPRRAGDLDALPVLRADRFLHAPEPASRMTCAALTAVRTVDPELRDWDGGRWAGRDVDTLAQSEPDGVATWLAGPSAAPHGGESLLDLLDRVRRWLSVRRPGHTVAVCGPAVARAAVVLVLGAPPAGFWRVEAAPLTATDLRGGPLRWAVRTAGKPLRRSGT